MVPTNHSQAKLFDKKFVALTLREVRRCSKCKREYDVKYKVSATDNKPRSSRPVLLNCGHNICENCIYQNRHNLICAVCQIPIEFEHTRWLKKCYDLNFCLLGQLVNSQSFLTSETTAQINYAPAGMLAQDSFVQKCSECEQAAAVGICMHCKVDFCKRCFTSVHQNSKVLKKHKLSEFEMQTLQLQLPKEKFCKMHKRLCDKFCQDCQGVFCSQCARTTHNTHRVHSLSVENEKHKDKIISFLETMKQTRENIRKAQKEARVCENRLEDFATGTILEVSDFFLELHNHLQLEEHRILEQFKKSARSSQKAIHEAFAKLSDGQTTLNNMRSSLEGYLHKPPNDVHIKAVIELATTQLEQIPCQLQISEIEKNPYIFKKLKDMRQYLSKSYEATALDPKIRIRISPMYGDLGNSFEISSDRVSPDPMQSVDNCHASEVSILSAPTFTVGKSKRVGRITNIINPEQFYVQDEEALAEIRSKLVKQDEKNGHVESLNMGEMYIVYNVTDKAWFRGILKENCKKANKKSEDDESTTYKVFLLDYGVYDNVQKKWFREIFDKLDELQPAAVSCGVLDVAPVEKEWSSEARELMEEIIQNKPVQIIIQDTTKSPWRVEVFTSSSTPISIRDTLIYTGLAIDTSAGASQTNLKYAGIKPTQVSKIKHRLLRPMLHPGEIFRVKITHIENPQQFFAVKFSQLEQLALLESELDLEYSSNQSDKIYYAQSQMCCALLNEDKWYRGCIEEINNPSSILVRLVDDGRSVTVNWRELYVLKDQFVIEQELSIECSVADIQPLQENNYEWTDTAIAEFVRMTSNPNIQLMISSSSQFRYQVVLNVIKKHLDINIGAMLVKFNHALTTGEGSAIAENLCERLSPSEQILIPKQETNQHPASKENPILRTLKRTPIQVININNPGEFYIHLVEHIPGILKFHEELQLCQERRIEEESPTEDIDWKENDHCLVFTNINELATEQWFRGVILELDNEYPETPYVVFLRDKGVTVQNILKNQLAPIDSNLDRVCNAAVLCHLACVHPTGGLKTWSHSSTDEFIHNVGTFDSLGATIQGATKNGSIPIVLWGMKTETNDALAPCTIKYTNINKQMVCVGLANLVEKIDITRQIDKFAQAEVEHGQQTLQEWYEHFKKTIEELPSCIDNIDDNDDDKSLASSIAIADPLESFVAKEWLPAEPIEKTIFTAYPTYVDEDAIVYMHDAEKHSLLTRMRVRINQDVELKPLSSRTNDEKWSVGKPCLARYHLDKSLYRAVIHRSLPDGKYEVRFIDYGNTEICEIQDLHNMTAFPNIPTQAVRFRIDGIRPKGGQPKFSITVLDLIHGVIVDKLCAIRVPNGEAGKEIKKCSIRFDRNDLATYLVRNGFACSIGNRAFREKPSNTSKKLTPLAPLPVADPQPMMEEIRNDMENELREFMKHQICDPTGEPLAQSPQSTPKHKPNAMFKPEEYKKIFDKMQADKLRKPISEDEDSDEDVVELEFSFRSNYWHVDDNLENAPPMPKSEVGSNFEAFDPQDTSSLLSNFSGIEAFKSPQLPSSVKSFYCDVAYARSPTVLHVFPHLSELEYRQIELARRIQLMVRKIPPLTSFEVKTPCLARYSKDKLWYRAIIRSHNITTRQVKVFYVDFLNSELISEGNVRKCPKDLLSWPLRTFEFKLFGLKPNPRMREKDVKLAIKKCLSDRILYAKIMRERGKMIEICLFESKTEKSTPVYEDLIVQKYYCRE